MTSEDFSNEKLLFIGFPSTGLVGAFALAFLVKHLNMERIGELDFPEISPTYSIQNGKVFGPMQIYKKKNVYSVIAGIPLPSLAAYDFVNASIEFGKKHGLKKIIVPRGIEVIGEDDILPKSFGLAVNEKSKKLLKEYNLPMLPNASLFGSDAGVISALKKSVLPSIIVYTNCRLRFPDDDAIIKSIQTLANIMKTKVDTNRLEEQLKTVSKENERLIEETKEALGKLAEKPAAMPSPGIA